MHTILVRKNRYQPWSFQQDFFILVLCEWNGKSHYLWSVFYYNYHMHIATLYKVRPAITLLSRISRDSDWTKIREGELPSVPSLYRGTFEVTEEPKDTFLHMKGWTKGVCFINGHNLGRYWKIGPQETLYLPAPWLNKGRNEVCYLTWNTVKSNFEFFEPRTMVTLQESFATDLKIASNDWTDQKI